MVPICERCKLLLMLRFTRATRYLPRVRGVGRIVGPIQSLYLPFLAKGATFRINNFDSDLKLDVRPEETIGSALWHVPQLYERHERRLFCEAITPGCTVLDVGANIGIYTLLAAKRGAHVFAIECDPSNAAMLRHHLGLNGLAAAVRIFDIAASDHIHFVGLHRNPRNCGGSSVVTGSEIKAATIDSLNLPPIDVCKMDIEGSELPALRGMERTLNHSPRLKMLVEYNALSDRASLLDFLRRTFRRIAPAGKRELRPGQDPPSDCNLWCQN